MVAASPALDDSALVRILAFTSELKARPCCQSWAKHLFDELQLDCRIRFNKLIRKQGTVTYHHSAVRRMGDDFEECVAYQFEFFAAGSYELIWNRSFGQWSAANERQAGRWHIEGDKLRCETIAGPEDEDGKVRYAAAGRISELPLETVLKGNTAEDDMTPIWEYQVRGQPIPETMLPTCIPRQEFSEQQDQPAVTSQADDALFVEVDGDWHEVSADIRDNYPEEQWERLMRCRVRFGIS
mmetsp:Transcript_60681/g.109339  ORF Transcript_60681/g.109339 Transcript_60681/m.109339 type:complete len:240 (-) Transcript_60681:67-786(-)